MIDEFCDGTSVTGSDTTRGSPEPRGTPAGSTRGTAEDDGHLARPSRRRPWRTLDSNARL